MQLSKASFVQVFYWTRVCLQLHLPNNVLTLCSLTPPHPFTIHKFIFWMFSKVVMLYLYYIKRFECFHLKSLKLQQFLFQTHLSRNILRKSVICHLYSNTKTSNHFFHDALSCRVVRITGLTFWIKKKPTSPENHTLHC